MKITLKHNNGDSEVYNLLLEEPPTPYVQINDYYLRLSPIKEGTVFINNLYPYVEKILYCCDENGVLRKLDTHNDKQIWETKIADYINSIDLNKYNNIYVGIQKSIKQTDNNKNEICTICIPNNYIKLKDNYIYIAKKNKLIKFNLITNKEECILIFNNNIKQVLLDNNSNIYIVFKDKVVKVLSNNFKIQWEYLLKDIRSIYINSNDEIFISDKNEIIKINANSKIVGKYNINEICSNIVFDKENKYYVNKKEINKLDKNNNKEWSYTNNNNITCISIEN